MYSPGASLLTLTLLSPKQHCSASRMVAIGVLQTTPKLRSMAICIRLVSDVFAVPGESVFILLLNMDSTSAGKHSAIILATCEWEGRNEDLILEDTVCVTAGINAIELLSECSCWVVDVLSDVRSSVKHGGIFFSIVELIDVALKDGPILVLGEIPSFLDDRCILRCFVQAERNGLLVPDNICKVILLGLVQRLGGRHCFLLVLPLSCVTISCFIK